MISGSVSPRETLPFALSPADGRGALYDLPYLYVPYKNTNRIDGRALYSGAWITEKR